MPRRAKGPRLYLKQREGREPVWVVRDGAYERSTGCGADRLGEAESHLADRILSKATRAAVESARQKSDPAQVGLAEVIALYLQERAPNRATDKASTAGFFAHLLAWWGDKTVADVKRSTCKAYIAHRVTMPDARYKNPVTAPRVSEQTAARELDDLSAAIGYWHGEDTLTARPKVAKPDKPESPREALTRSQAAALLKAAMGWRKTEDGWERLGGSARANRAHLRRFILIGLYTGTRHSAIRALLWEESLHQAWVDLEKGMIYRRGRGERETTKRRPVVKIPARLLAHMKRWRKMDLATETRRRDAARPETGGRSLLSVLHHGGEPIRGKIRTGFEGCIRDAGLPAEITPHWMRHSAATWLMEGGADMWTAASYLGMTVATLEKHYGHHRPDHQAGAIRAIGGRK